MQSRQPINSIVIVGGGSAGWITAGLLAAEYAAAGDAVPRVTLVESPDVRTIGVGEGTWPTMRTTLQQIGIPEAEFLTECFASFKQGTQFCGWVNGDAGDSYYHPFSAPAGYPGFHLAPYWQAQKDRLTFVDAVTSQGFLCDRYLAPKQASTPEYAAVANYGYHLDAGRFAALLQRHCTGRLGVRHIVDHVTAIRAEAAGDITAVATLAHGDIAGDLFVDCSGFASLLLGDHYGVPYIDRSDILFNDTALAVQVPYDDPQCSIASQTLSTAQPAGWIWDIGLSTRRGVGYVYSSAHSDDETAAERLRRYIAASASLDPDSLTPRKLSFRPGHRERFWHRNCVAVGMSAGFLEPLEASALVLVELSARMISESLPATRDDMDQVARRFNDTFRYRWQRIIDFLKLHYVLSRRDDSAYWRDNREAASLPDGLADQLAWWRHHVPGRSDFAQVDEVFSAASYQYVLYGMGFETRPRPGARQMAQDERARRLFNDTLRTANQHMARLPSNRELLTRIAAHGLPLSQVG